MITLTYSQATNVSKYARAIHEANRALNRLNNPSEWSSTVFDAQVTEIHDAGELNWFSKASLRDSYINIFTAAKDASVQALAILGIYLADEED